MKCNHLLLLIVFIFVFVNVPSYAFNDSKTHPAITKAATAPSVSIIKSYLTNSIGFKEGYDEILKGIDRNGYEQHYPVWRWLQEGSTDEDALNICRASNHFHDPIRSGDWLTSQMSDSLWVDAFCGTSKRYSDVTWATGYGSPTDYIGARTGQYLYLTGLSDAPQDTGWDSARLYFYDALIHENLAAREAQFVRTFKSLGMILHLLQDMAVPAHVRNDMESHLFNAWNPNNWSNPFEKYVVINNSAINIDPNQFKPSFGVSPRVTDFWDKDVYTGSNPSTGTGQGLAEYANANFFTGSTIPQDTPSQEHRFPYPQITEANYICADKLPGSSRLTKYVSRTPCPVDGSSVDHFAAVSLMNRKGTLVPTIKKVWLDNNVHDTYAKQILPRAVGYSAALLDYFFRGKLAVSLSSATSSAMKFMVKNDTSGEAMTGGKLALVLRYKQLVETGDTMVAPTSDLPFSYQIIELPVQAVPSGTAAEYAFNLTQPLPLWTSELAIQIVYRGALGNEADAVAVSPWHGLQRTAQEIALSLPPSGVYAASSSATPFTQIKVNAQNNLPNGQSMTDGTVSLYLLHRTATTDPFQSMPVTTTPATGYSLIKVAHSSIRSLLTNAPIELAFDISATPLPLWATDVHLYVIYQGTVSDGTVTTPNVTVAGMLDISEPSPLDVFNNSDKVCVKGVWYNAGAPATLDLRDTNGNLIAAQADLYAHNIANIFSKASSTANAKIASISDFTFSSPALLTGGNYRRLGYILTDYSFKYSNREDWLDADPADPWETVEPAELYTGTAVKNQDGEWPGMFTLRGTNNKIWWGAGVVYDNPAWPPDKSADEACGWNNLP